MTFQLKKRLFDMAVAVPSVIIFSPFLILIGFLVRTKIGSSVLFRQVRPGLQGKPFTIYKFRTMTDERDEDWCLLPDGERLTKVGRFLRITSLDELPELFSVIKGEMSIAGYKPEVVDRESEGRERQRSEDRGQKTPQ